MSIEGSNSRQIDLVNAYDSQQRVAASLTSHWDSHRENPDGKPASKAPKRLAEKLRAIRLGLGLSQTQMLKRLEHEKTMHYGRISEYESGKREPTLMTILQYVRVAGVHLDIVDDELELPKKLPGDVKYRDIKRKSASGKKESASA